MRSWATIRAMGTKPAKPGIPPRPPRKEKSRVVAADYFDPSILWRYNTVTMAPAVKPSQDVVLTFKITVKVEPPVVEGR